MRVKKNKTQIRNCDTGLKSADDESGDCVLAKRCYTSTFQEVVYKFLWAT